MHYSKKIEGDSFCFSLVGKFTREDFETSKQFMGCIQESKPREVVFDMAGLTFIDSSALGQLLYLREVMQDLHGSIILRNPTGHVKKMLNISNFYELFQIED